MSEAEKTHLLTSDCIITEIGRCEAGKMIDESDVLPSTWTWLQERNFLKSVADIESEADLEDSESEQDAETVADTEGSESQQTPDTGETTQAGAAEAPENKKPTGGKARK